MSIPYIAKSNQRTLGNELLIVNELHTIGITGLNTVTANQIRLIEVPKQEIPSSVAIPGFTEVTTAPGTNEFKVDYGNGRITFNAVQNGNTVFVTYKGRGSVVDAEDVNEIQQALGGIADLDGTLGLGVVTPDTISTVITDNFTFPNDVVVNGDLTVNGTTTTVQSTTVTIADNILLLDSNVTGTPSLNAGLEVERGTSPNVQLVWDESVDAWSLNNSSGNPILRAFDTLDSTMFGSLTVDVNVSILGTTFLSDGSASSPSLSFTSDTNTGLYHVSADTLGITTGGSVKWTINSSGDLSDQTSAAHIYTGNGAVAIPSVSFNSDTDTGMYRVAANTLGFVTNGAEAIRIDASQNVGLGVTPVAKFHNSGSTLFGLTTATNPVSVPTATVDGFTGIVITTTAVVSVILASPTNTTQGRFFTVLHNDTSTGTLSVNNQSVGEGKGIPFMWDGTAWIPVGGSGGFNLMAGDPGSPQQGDTWFDTTTNQFKGYNGTNNVVLG